MVEERYFRNKVNHISFICAVLVVLLHSFSFNGGKADIFAYTIEFFLSRNIAQASVPTFFALSAFLFYRNFSYSRLLGKLKSRFRSLVIPYILWNIISMVIFFFISKLPFINTEPFSLGWDTLVEGIVFYGYNLVFWFVFQLILLTYLFPLLYPILKNKVLAITLFLLLVCVYSMDTIQIWRIEIKAVIFYFFGAYFAVHHEKMVICRNKVSIIGVTAFLLSQILIYSSAAEEPFVYILTRICMIIAVFEFAGLLSKFELPALLNCSFPIYAMHNLILETFNKVFSFILEPSSNLILVDYFGSTIVTVLIIMVVNYGMAKYTPRVHNVLFGGRAR